MKRESRQLYRKLRFFYTVILICVVGLLVAYSISASRRQEQDKNLEYMRMAGTEARDYILQCAENASYFHGILYNSYNELDDLRHYLTDDVDEYMRFRLDSYGSSTSVAYSGIEGFISSMFGSYSQLETIRLYSLAQEIMTHYESDGTRRREVMPMQQAQEAGREAVKGGHQKEALSFRKDLLDPITLAPIGWVELGFSGRRFQDIVALYDKAQMVVCNSYDEVVFLSGEDVEWGGEIGALEEEESLYVREEVADSYGIATILPKKDAARIPLWNMLVILALGALLIGVGEMGISLYLAEIMKRLGMIVEGMEKVKRGELNTRISFRKKGDELDIIADNFNLMCQDLNLYIQKSYLAEIEQKNAEMEALQSQINPHFLYNTLEAIRMKAICNGDREVGRMLYSMAALFQSQLKEADVITLARELHYAKRYMELFEYRYLGKFSWKVSCGDGFLQVPIIKFVVQPVLENYFEHGIRLEANDNIINLSVKEMGKFLLILVEDNGRGMTEQEMEEKNTALQADEMDFHKSMGLGNVNRRLKAVYGPECGLTLSTGSLGGLVVTLRFLADNCESGRGTGMEEQNAESNVSGG